MTCSLSHPAPTATSYADEKQLTLPALFMTLGRARCALLCQGQISKTSARFEPLLGHASYDNMLRYCKIAYHFRSTRCCVRAREEGQSRESNTQCVRVGLSEISNDTHRVYVSGWCFTHDPFTLEPQRHTKQTIPRLC